MNETWIKNLEERDNEDMFRDKVREWDQYGKLIDKLPTEYHYLVIIPVNVYEQLSQEQKQKFEECDLTKLMDEDFIFQDYGVNSNELNQLWQRKFYNLTEKEQKKWTDLEIRKNIFPINEVLVFCAVRRNLLSPVSDRRFVRKGYFHRKDWKTAQNKYR